MAIILSIETSTSVCAAALHESGNLIASQELHTPRSAASQLAVMVERLFSEAKISMKRLNAVAVSAGPGSYTGLRIGVATAKGICYGLSIPLIAIDSLHALASTIVNSETAELFCPMIDARRMEVYCCLLDRSFQVMEETQAKVIDEHSFLDYLGRQSILFFGNGALKCKTMLNHPNALFLENINCSAAGMGKLAFNKFHSGEFADLGLFEPNYLKDFVAKTKSV